MQLKHFVSESANRVRRDGIEGFQDVLHGLYRGFFWQAVSRVYDGGVRVYDRDWDVLVILDACRADVLEEVADEYEFVTDVRAVWSAASNSEEWLEKTFVPRFHEQMEKSAYVTANPFSESYLTANQFASLDEVWQHAWSGDLGTVPPQPITDAAIACWRSEGLERMIVHYMQPHFPSIPHPELGSEASERKGSFIWEQVRKGEVSKERAWEAYRENLRHVLDSVGLLVRSIDAETVAISADHANSFGSWGLYGHPRAPIPAIRTVPWCELSAEDVSGYEPSATDSEVVTDGSEVESRLRALGYV